MPRTCNLNLQTTNFRCTRQETKSTKRKGVRLSRSGTMPKKKKTQEYKNFLRQDLPKVEFKKNNGTEVRCHSRQAKYLADVTNSLSMQVPLLIIKCFPPRVYIILKRFSCVCVAKTPCRQTFGKTRLFLEGKYFFLPFAHRQ